MESETNNQTNSKSIKKNKNPYMIWIMIIAIVLILTLPFHYIPSQMRMFPKKTLTFNYTIITEDDIEGFVERYNNARKSLDFLKIQEIRDEPVVKKLMEEGIIYETK